MGWIDLGPQTFPASEFRENVDRYAELATSYATLADYDVVYFVGLTDAADQEQVGWGLQNYLGTSQGTATVGIDYMINSFFFREAGTGYPYSVILPSRSWAHELVHTFGAVGHDISLDCGSAAYGPSCARFTPYGNPFSAMGESVLGNHPSTHMKSVLGWLERTQLETVTASGERTLCSTESTDGKAKALVIPLRTPLSIANEDTGTSSTFDRLIVEYRRPLGFDRYVERLGTSFLDRFKTDGPVQSDGVLVSRAHGRRRRRRRRDVLSGAEGSDQARHPSPPLTVSIRSRYPYHPFSSVTTRGGVNPRMPPS